MSDAPPPIVCIVTDASITRRVSLLSDDGCGPIQEPSKLHQPHQQQHYHHHQQQQQRQHYYRHDHRQQLHQLYRDDCSEFSWEYSIESSQTNSRTNLNNGSISRRRESDPRGRRRNRVKQTNGSESSAQHRLPFRSIRKLYGRSAEYTILRTAWEEVRSGPLSSLQTSSKPDRDKTVDSCPCEDNNRKLIMINRRFITISGESGTGKSSLAQQARELVHADNGLFLSGSFPQQHTLSRHAVEPYAAFEEACSDLCELILQRNTSHAGALPITLNFSLVQFQDKLESELGSDVLILTSIIPGLLQLLPRSTSIAASDPSIVNSLSNETDDYLEAHHQFKFAFRRFIRVVTSFAPVLLVLDDLQWADHASMELLEALVSDRENSRFMVVGCYRDDEVFQTMPHLDAIARIDSIASNYRSFKCESICLGALSISVINEFLVDLLTSTPDATCSLAECVFKKTMGNAFFVVQYLTLLQEMSLLKYDVPTKKWQWDVVCVQQLTTATDNVVNLMKSKMESLPACIRSVFPVMACLGSTFDSNVLDLVLSNISPAGEHLPEIAENSIETSRRPSEDSERSIPSNQLQLSELAESSTGTRLIRECVEVGLIELVGETDTTETYRWIHDKIQESAFHLITHEELRSMKLQIGGILFEGFDADELERRIFTVVNLLSSTDAVYDSESLPRTQPLKVAELFLQAGVKAIDASAFEQASSYLNKAIELLPANHWQNQYSLSLEIFSTAAESEYCTGCFDLMRQYCNDVIQQIDRPLLDKRRAYNLLLASTAAEKGFGDALDFALMILKKIGVRFPRKALWVHVDIIIVRVHTAMRRYSAETIASLPLMVDEMNLWTMSLLDKAFTYAYLSKSTLLPLVVLKSLRLTLSNGICRYSPYIMVTNGFLLSAFGRDFKGGVEFVNQAIKLLDQSKAPRQQVTRVRMIGYGLVLHWLQPLHQTLPPLREAFEMGMTVGNTEDAAWSIFFYSEYGFWMGFPLGTIIRDLDKNAERLREVKQLNIRVLLLILWQVILFLTGENAFTGSLAGDVLDHNESKAFMEEEWFSAQVLKMLMYTACLFDQHHIVFDCMKKVNFINGYYDFTFPGTAGVYRLYAYNGLSMISLHMSTKDRSYLRLAKKCFRKIRHWALSGNPNVTHFDSLLEADFLSLGGQHYEASRSYEFAIYYASKRSFTQDQALAHERFGEHFLRLGSNHCNDASFQIGEAIRLFGEWGAKAKVVLLQRKYADLL